MKFAIEGIVSIIIDVSAEFITNQKERLKLWRDVVQSEIEQYRFDILEYHDEINQLNSSLKSGRFGPNSAKLAKAFVGELLTSVAISEKLIEDAHRTLREIESCLVE